LFVRNINKSVIIIYNLKNYCYKNYECIYLYLLRKIINLFYFLIKLIFFYLYLNNKIGDWGLGIGDWGLGIGDWAQSPIPNPQSPTNDLISTLLLKL